MGEIRRRVALVAEAGSYVGPALARRCWPGTVAMEVARYGVQVNAVGSNFMGFPEFLASSRATDPEARAKLEAAVPLHRFGTMEELAAFCMAFLDGTSRFTTGQFVAYAGGWA